ncbi:MAG: hypothetical protein AAF696_17875 [Bacteroidota bacterium]
MFQSLPHHFREHKLNADVRTLLLLRKAMEKGLVRTLGDLYLSLRSMVAKDPKDYGPFTIAFYDYFLAIDIKHGESLESAVIRSESFKQWRHMIKEEEKPDEEPDVKELLDRYLDEVHLTSFDIQKVLSGEDIFKKSEANRPDLNPDEDAQPPEKVDKAADYRNISMEDMMKRLEEIAKRQKGKHSGGSHWIGTGGRSAFGNNGAAFGGVRMGGSGGGKTARAVIGDRRYYPVDKEKTLTDDGIDVALAALKGIEEESSEEYLDIPVTIKEGLKQGGIFLPHIKEKINPKIQVALFIDNGGMSMLPYVRLVSKLFAKMKKRFAHDLKTYYYHNTLYKGAYTDERRRKFESIDKICSLDKNYSVFIIGDADMAPYELSTTSRESWQKLRDRFERIIWLNPMNEKYWYASDTIPILKQLIPMEPLSPKGIEKAVEEMNRKRKYAKL